MPRWDHDDLHGSGRGGKPPARLVVVSGGRDRHQTADDAWWLRAWLLHLGATDLAHGACRHTGCGVQGCERRSVDQWAGEVGHRLGLRVQQHPARWADLGRAAGLVRNLQMLDLGPVAVLALPGARVSRTQSQVPASATSPTGRLTKNAQDRKSVV